MKTVHLNSRNLAGLVTQAIPTVMALGFLTGFIKAIVK